MEKKYTIEDDEIIIRTVRYSDLEKLKAFFISAYGESTVFQNEKFLLYYFKTIDQSKEPLSYSLVGVTLDGEIISHYGGLQYKLKLKNKIINVIWGVNAFTLPEWRGKGTNSKMVRYVHEHNEANAVIGMSQEAPFFYEKFGYNFFNKETLNRFIYTLNLKAFDIASNIGINHERVTRIIKIKDAANLKFDSGKIVELTKNNLEDYNFNFDIDDDLIATTFRDIHFLKWRLFENKFIKYNVFGYLNNNNIVSYIVNREEKLIPLNYKINRIIDIFGNKEGVINLLNYTLDYSLSNGSIYIDFSMHGKQYEKELITVGFDKLENDDVCILPMVTSPIENRPNHEFIGIQSKFHNDEIHKLTTENVYFTRIDSDRDRIARITQINDEL